MPTPHPSPDSIVTTVLTAFHALPSKFRPRSLADGRREWVPLAGIVLSRPPNKLRCVSLATGMKCLPQEKVKTAKGNVMHDSHAEVLAIRGFNRWLVDECADLARKGLRHEGKWVRWRIGAQVTHNESRGREHEADMDGEGNADPLFELVDDVSIHMYCSSAPCGDASMELVMRSQADSTPWDQPATTPGDDKESDVPGRGFFSQLGVVRRKPSRPDAPVTLSKSCSDKLAMKQCTGLLSSTTSLLLSTKGTWLSTLVLPEREIVTEAMERCFGPMGRMAPLAAPNVQNRWRVDGYTFQPFVVQGTGVEFEYSKSALSQTTGEGKVVPSNLATVVTAPAGGDAEGPDRREVLINGVLQGRKQDDPRGASCVSRRRIWEAVRDVLREKSLHGWNELMGVEGMTYAEMKGGRALEGRRRVKQDVRDLALKGWRRNEWDEGWVLDAK